MLELTIDAVEVFAEVDGKMKILKVPARTLRLEHSLSALSKWEDFWESPFYSRNKRTPEQLLSYIRFMSDEPVDDNTLGSLTKEHFDKIHEFLSAKRSATWFSDEDKESPNGPVVTSELIYYWMSAFGIPFECDEWPLPRLMNLIKIHQIKAEQQSGKKNKRPTSQILSERAALNAKRRKELNTEG